MDPTPPHESWLTGRTTWLVGATLVVGLAGALVLRRAARAPGGLDVLRNSLRADAPRAWVVIDGKHWHLDGEPGEEPGVTDAREGTRGPCPDGMVHASGAFLLDANGNEGSGGVERLQDEACSRWIDREFPARCAAFDRAKWLRLSEPLPRKAVNFCIDRFEYPNRLGASPWIVVSYREAQGLCAAEGRRLCTETEWTYACEGDEGQPYPYGYERDGEACVFDRPWRAWNAAAFAVRDGDGLRAELDRLWQGEPSGARPACRSPLGVYDLTGNVDEWTRSVRKEGFPSILKGGYWGPVRARCRPSTRAHGETFVAYQQGFRCCADSPDGPAPSRSGAAPAADRLPDDAGAPALDAGEPDGEAPPAPGPAADLRLDEGDELAALGRRGPAVACGGVVAPAAPRGFGAPLALAALAALGVRRRARRRVRP